jgi:hypothetical protein
MLHAVSLSSLSAACCPFSHLSHTRVRPLSISCHAKFSGEELVADGRSVCAAGASVRYPAPANNSAAYTGCECRQAVLDRETH